MQIQSTEYKLDQVDSHWVLHVDNEEIERNLSQERNSLFMHMTCVRQRVRGDRDLKPFPPSPKNIMNIQIHA